MKGFKPTGFGPTAGFTFPTKMGFTGSTGRTTAVAPYVRRKAFAEGGFVRQDTPRMKSESVGDSGSALQRRSRPTTELDAESGGRTPLRPGFKNGGKHPKKKMRKADGGRVSGPLGAGAMSDADREFLRKSTPNRTMSAREMGEMLRKSAPKKPTMPAGGMKGKFAAADGGKVVYGSSSKGVLKDYGQIIKDALRSAAPSTGMARDAANRISGRQRQVDTAVDDAVTGKTSASNYARGGKMKRMGYASGGAVSRGEAKKIAERTVGEHVRYPAPKGHRGLGQMMRKRT